MLTRCKFCGREARLWGGPSCDVCDRDSNGVNDRDDPIGTDATPERSVLPMSNGFVVTSPIRRKGALAESKGVSMGTLIRALGVLARRLQ